MIINKENKPKKKRAMSRIIIPFVIVSIFSFTIAAMLLQYKTNMELSPTLITCFYGFCTGELWLLASIKKTKVKNINTLNTNNDEENEG